MYNFEIRVGTHTDYMQNTLCYAMLGMMGNGTTEDFPCRLPTRGRYVSVHRVSPYGPYDNQLTVCEIQIFQSGIFYLLNFL